MISMMVANNALMTLIMMMTKMEAPNI
jgi:hypothetical protein